MTIATLAQWYYLIFLLPLGVSLFLLVLTSLRGGAKHGGHSHGGHSHMGHHGGGHAAHGHHTHQTLAGGPKHVTAKAGVSGAKIASQTDFAGMMLAIIGIGRVPVPLFLQMFALFWGALGTVANQMLLAPIEDPSLFQVLPSILIGLVGGLVGARFAAEMMVRLTPQMETSVVSQEGLYGLRGRVAFPVTDTGGRVLIYDENQTIHDERCRVAPGKQTIEKGRTVLVIDRDPDGLLLVEEI
jgi:hypothetical protein